jgi:hypothetical protein
MTGEELILPCTSVTVPTCNSGKGDIREDISRKFAVKKVVGASGQPRMAQKWVL